MISYYCRQLFLTHILKFSVGSYCHYRQTSTFLSVHVQQCHQPSEHVLRDCVQGSPEEILDTNVSGLRRGEWAA